MQPLAYTEIRISSIIVGFSLTNIAEQFDFDFYVTLTSGFSFKLKTFIRQDKIYIMKVFIIF